MTTQKPYIFDPVSGEWFRVAGFDFMKPGDFFLGMDGDVTGWTNSASKFIRRHILEPCDPPPLPQSKEVVEVLEAAKLFVERTKGWDDAAICYYRAEVANALAALPTPEPQERYTVEEIENTFGWRVCDGVNGVAHFEREQDAKDFAALKNERAGV